MMKFRVKIVALVALAVGALGFSALLPSASFATLNDIACNAIWRNCLGNCGATGNKQSCTDRCDSRNQDCLVGRPSSKQQSQTPPPPCTGVRCTLPKAHPPTVASPTTNKRPRPVKPAEPVGVSNPNKTTTGNNGEILLRKNDTGGDHKH